VDIITPTQLTPVNVLADVEVQLIDHLGLVAAAIDSLGLVQRIDKRLPMKEDSDIKMTHGQRFAAMIINGLGYTNAPLYMTSRFYQDKDIERLIGPGVEAEHLNDSALGRTLDAIFDYGTTLLFAEIAFEIAAERGLIGNSAHIDTTTLLLRGEFMAAIKLAEKMKSLPDELTEQVNKSPTPALGRSKAHRDDLKQVMMSLTVSGPASMPLWFESLPGNSSDKTSFHDSIAAFEAFRSRIDFTDELLWVADSALYCKEKLKVAPFKWLTRIPHTKGNAKMLVCLADSEIDWSELGNGYKGAIYDPLETGERWALYYSEQAYNKEIITLERRIRNAMENQSKGLRKLCRVPFDCEQDALKAADKWQQKLIYHKAEFTVETIERYSKRGKPPKGVKPDIIEYKLKGVLSDDDNKQQLASNQLGRFILSTNDVDNVKWTLEVLLSTYIEQQGVERGFRFIKSGEFHLDNIYLKLPSRIDALMMVMAFSLMVYNTTEYQMRESMAEQEVTLPNQKGKETTQPTLRWVFQMMQGVHTLKLAGVPDYVAGRNELRNKIIRLFGATACTIYGISN
jgi:transposase